MTRHAQKITNALDAEPKPTRRLAANASLETGADGTVTVVLHGTEIARRLPCGRIEARHGGFATRTTSTWVASAIQALHGAFRATSSIAGGRFVAGFAGESVEIGEDWTHVGQGRMAPQAMAEIVR
jgi:hypothetical protein